MDRGSIKDRTSIELRPSIVDEKTRIGDWEADTIVGASNRGAILTLVERKTKFLMARKLSSRSAKEVEEAMVSMLKNAPLPVLTITCDNGKEFSYHKSIAKRLDTEIYFAHPYSSWERGLNENTNGLLRQYITKKTDFKHVTWQYLRTSVKKINERPRKALSFLSPKNYIKKFNPKLHFKLESAKQYC